MLQTGTTVQYDFSELLITHTNKISANKELVTQIQRLTTEFDVDFVHIKQRIWHLVHSQTLHPLCPVCNTQKRKWDKQNGKYTDTCGYKCSAKRTSNDPVTRKKTSSTNLQRYGTVAPAQNPSVVNKATATKIERYGTDGGGVWRDKIKNTFLTRYGVDNPSRLSWVSDKKRSTWARKSVTQHQMISNQRSETSVSRYGVNNPNQRHMVDVLHLLNDYDWLYDQYIVQHKSIREISLTSLSGKCSTYPIMNKLHQMDIQIRATGSFSYSCIKWLNGIMEKDRIHIQHALNGGEYKIPNTTYKADGYCLQTNTIYEFHGDVFHGNPHLFDADVCCHPFSDKTAGQLLQDTMDREQKIKNLGYNLVTMWEYDWAHQAVA